MQSILNFNQLKLECTPVIYGQQSSTPVIPDGLYTYQHCTRRIAISTTKKLVNYSVCVLLWWLFYDVQLMSCLLWKKSLRDQHVEKEHLRYFFPAQKIHAYITLSFGHFMMTSVINRIAVESQYFLLFESHTLLSKLSLSKRSLHNPNSFMLTWTTS